MKLLPALAFVLAAVVVGNVRAQYNYGGTGSKTAYTGSGGSSNYQQTASKSTQYTQGSYNQPSSSKYTQGSYNQPSPSPSPTSQYTQQTNKYTPTGSYSNQQGYSYNNYQGYPSGGYQYPATTTKKSTGYGYTTPKTPTYGYTTPKTPTYGYTTPKTPTYGYSTPKTPTYGYTTPKNPSPTPYYTATPAPTPAPVYPPTTYPTSYNYWDPTKPTPYTWTECEINTIKKILYSWMDQDVIHLNRPATCLRLTFHDCVGVCDGCLNPLDPNNEGLTTIIEDLGTLWYYLFPSFFGKYMSNADFWWLAGIVAVQYTTDVNNYFCSGHTCVMPNLYIRFAYGRTDCRTTPYNNVTEGIPHAGMEYNETMTFYWNNFGFYPEEVVALMGVHTCGSMHSFNSGFDGKWKEDIEQLPFHLFFDDVYYLLLTAKRVNGVLLFWKNEVSSGISADTGNNLTVWQFEGYWDCNYNGIDDDSENEACHATTMLPLDISMVYDIQLDQFMRSNCVPPYCPITPMYWLAVEFALNSTFWSQEFICAYEKMSLNRVNLNYMQLPGDCTASCIAPVVTQYPFTNNLPVVVCDR